MKLFHCRICGPNTPIHSSGAICGGCGTPIANATHRPRKQKTNDKIDCPRCRKSRPKGKYHSHSDGSLVCPNCRAEFEHGDDVTFCDSRPDRNAEKREEFQNRRRQRR